ncbi:uncharacterized protein LOC128302933 [Anopheles moucheti]|uniref:uncharacterized protein LOC128302933 n=1 Tax=Anopheles moucheti TaxID=186751 RepID=UPI0022F071FC|nr:uncharacterized protein LOC128302933 [Anopheles moucheti]
MPKRICLLLISVLLVICDQPLQTNAKECIDMAVHAREVVSCCQYEAFCSEEVDEQCNQQLRPQIPPNSPNFTVCFLDCAYREMGFLTENNEIDLPKYAAYLSPFDKNYRIVTANAVGDCAAIQQDILRDVDQIPSRCSAFALLFHVCVTQLTLRNCPAERWATNEICKEASKVATCCKHEAFMDAVTFANCFKTIDAQNPEKDVQSVVCAFDCAYREMGLLHGEDDIDVENVSKFHTQYDEAYQQTIAKAVDHCIANKDNIRREAELAPTTCSAFAVKFHACVALQVVLNCPVGRWTDTPICEQVKSGTPICEA